MAKAETEQPGASDGATDNRGICGIVMPIASMGDDYPEDHWRRVRKILQRAIEKAGMQSQLVWDNAEIDVIQSAILKNLYENDVIICDLSGLNPNVMLETGLRLSTKRPTIIVTDRLVKPPFDIATIGYIEYQKDLEYNAIEDFIDRLSKKIITLEDSFKKGTYSSFVEQFTFETVTPKTVSVPAEEYLKEQISLLVSSVRRIEHRQRVQETEIRHRSLNESREIRMLTIKANLTRDIARNIETEIDTHPAFGLCTVVRDDDGGYSFHVPMAEDSNISRNRALQILKEIVERGENESVPF